jgi:hypothetical protein
VTGARACVAPAILAGALAAAGCGRGAGSSASTATAGVAAPFAIADGGAGRVDPGALASLDGAPSDPREIEAWARATQGDEDELARLATSIGCAGLRERAEVPALRVTALRAMGACDDFSELAWLATVTSSGPDADSAAAIDAILDEAARPRRAVDPEDADEIADGCQTLLVLARAADRPKTRRVGAIRALRMLAEHGCVKPADIPTEFDANANK